jgi:orotidine-5'-phosphate decarboxylase
MDSKDRLIVALDVFTLGEAEGLVSRLKDKVRAFKVGLQLLTACGSTNVLALMNNHNVDVFYDAKFNDIPNTVGQASKAISGQGVWMYNIHASAGAEAIRLAAANKGASKLIAVTVLTSLNDKTSNFVFGNSAGEKSLQLAELGAKNGIDGLVCSPHEIQALRDNDSTRDLILIVPGVRPTWADKNDQSRFMEPGKAVALGADYLVVGRPITAPPAEIGSAEKAVERIRSEIDIVSSK